MNQFEFVEMELLMNKQSIINQLLVEGRGVKGAGARLKIANYPSDLSPRRREANTTSTDSSSK
jgi:hypothetical protein